MGEVSGRFLRGLSSLLLLTACAVAAASRPTRSLSVRHSAPAHIQETSRVRRHMASLQHSHAAASTRVAGQRRGVVSGRGRTGSRVVLVRRHGRLMAVRHARYGEHFSAPSFAENIDSLTLGDSTAGEDAAVRASLIEALGNFNGTALAIDPKTGRILSMVNQKMALGPGAEPCSTIKLTVALAALSEGLVRQDTPVNLGGNYRVDLTYALAKSINPYFEVLGRQLGFERVKHYANEFGLGELAGYNIRGEQLGVYPDHELPLAKGGVGRMCSFGESVSMTPMQLGAIVSAIANGGSLYYLQHPTTPEEVAGFQPRLKRTLNIAPIIPEMLPGMAGAVNSSFGTARSLRSNFSEFPVLGKTGTCSNNGTRYGWFAGYGDGPNGRIVTVFFLTGGRPTYGPKAAELTGVFYRSLAGRSYFGPHVAPGLPAETVSSLSSTAASQ